MAYIATELQSTLLQMKRYSIEALKTLRIRAFAGKYKARQQMTPNKSGIASRLRLALIICLSAFTGDALNVITPSQGFEISEKRWHSNVTLYSSRDCPNFVVELIPSVIEAMTPIDNSYGGKTNEIGFDLKPTI
jgi:hypothetical protein